MLKLALSQINPTVGDFSGNRERMLKDAQQAHLDGAHMLVFSELCLCGYYPGDWLEEESFLRQADQSLGQILTSSRRWPDLTLVFGTLRANRGAGKPLHNALLAVRNGQIVAEYYKQLLPTYGIFDEYRHFEPGPETACVLDIQGQRVGFLICEDGWNDQGQDYRVNPFNALAAARPDLVVSINASPSNVGKRDQRHHMFADAVLRHGLPLAYVNQVGGQDQLVFDGASFVISDDGRLAWEARHFEEDYALVGYDRGQFTCLKASTEQNIRTDAWSQLDMIKRQIVLGLRDYARRCGFTQALVGSSGGIDSALTLALAVEALGADNVIAVTMPSEYSSKGSVSDSEALCSNLGVRLYTHPIKELVSNYKTQFETAFGEALRGIALENLQARIRGTILMEYSNAFGALLLTTGNKSEISVGYCTLYGDTNGGLGLIGDLYKTEVFALSRYINDTAGRALIPESILTKAPSAELAPDQKDTDSLPAYEVLDEILKWHIEGKRLSKQEYEQARAAVGRLDATPEGRSLLTRVQTMVARNEYKRRQAPPIIRVRARAFGSGRQMPIAARIDLQSSGDLFDSDSRHQKLPLKTVPKTTAV